MAEQVRVYAGTETGLSVWREAAGRRWEQVGSGIMGEPCRAITGSHERPEIVVAGVEHDGIYRTEDGGQHWTKVLDHDVWSIKMDPTDERVIYAGTAPVHLFRSEDQGKHWEELPGLQELPPEIKVRQFYPGIGEESHILYIFVDPENPDHLYLSLEHGGVIRSLDRGKTFEDVTEGIDYVDIHMVQKLPGRERYLAATARGFFATDDPARGWVRAEKGFTRDYFYKYIIMPPVKGATNPTIIVSTGDKSPGSWRRPEGALGALFRSDDCAESWYRVGNNRGLPENMHARAWYFTPHPHDPDGVFGGFGSYLYPDVDTGPGAVMVSHDRGASWEQLDIQVKPVWGLWTAPES
jgi:photosystem II stability/assembly factor-like uncharacterized protein